jgi:uncharacterized protein (TIGR03437 family)
MGYIGLPMSASRVLAIYLLGVWSCSAATFGTVVAHAQPLADLAIDEARRRLYVVNTASNQVEVYATSSNPPRQTNIIKTEATPLSIAMSPSGNFLYVACYDASSINIIDLRTTTFSSRSVTLSAKPQAVAVGADEKVLISTIGTGTGANALVTYDPNATASNALRSLTVAPAAPVAPQFPPPNGIMYLAAKARLQASADGTKIIGVHMQANTRTVFVYDSASSMVLSSRTVTGISPILAVAADGSRFLSGPLLFETSTMLVLAQQNTTNSPYVMQGVTATTFNTQTSQGGAVFLPDGSQLLAAYNIVPLAVPAAKSNTAQLTVNTPDTMLIQQGIVLPENLGGKIAITSDAATAYAISQSGFMVLPLSTLRNQPLGAPDSNVALLATDQCGVTAPLNSATISVRDNGGGRLTVTAQPVASTATSGTYRTTARPYGADVTAQISAAAGRTLGTATPDQLLIQAAEAVNIIPNVRVFQNSRNAESRGTLIPIDWGASATGLGEMLTDTARQRLYIANPGLNRIEVFDMQKRQLMTPIAVGQLPRSMAFGSDNNTMYVANSGGENISIVDLNQGKAVGRVRFPPIPFNASFALITPSLIASSQRGPQVIMSDGTLWKIVGDSVLPRPLNTNVFGTTRSIAAPFTMASTPDGSYVLVLGGTGTAYLYSASDDDFVSARAIVTGTITGYYGAIAAGSNGQYFLVNDQILNQALVPVGSTATGPVGGGGLPGQDGPAATGRPVSAVTALTATTFARFSTPVTAANATPADAGLVEVIDVNTQRTSASANALEGPTAIARTGQRVNVQGRSMALDAAGTAAFVLTASGISVIPLDTPATSAPQVAANGVVSAANFQTAIAPNGLISIMGRNLASSASAAGTPLPTVLGGACVTLNNTPLPLLATAGTQINAQLPATLAAGRYPLVVRSIAGQGASTAINVTVAKYAPTVFMDADGPLIFHADGTRVNQDHPGKRDERLTMYATGLGVTTGGKVTAGSPSPSSPLAVTAPVNVYFGNPLIKEAAIIVDWSGLMPGLVGVYQLNLRIPGAHINGDALPVTIKIGGVSSPTTGSNVPTVWVR